MKLANRLTLALMAILPTLGGCGARAGDSAGPRPESNTNWLRHCVRDDDCDGELSCLCGICTTGCESAQDCTSPAGTPESTLECVTSGSGIKLPMNCRGELDSRQSACVAECSTDRDCTRVGADATCESGICTRPPPKQEAPAISTKPQGSTKPPSIGDPMMSGGSSGGGDSGPIAQADAPGLF
ncbi:MAG: hypothetical protein RJA70_4669, partial [Pseudomonadota bacterium]